MPPAQTADGPVRLGGTLVVRDAALLFIACGTLAERPLAALPNAQLHAALIAVNGDVRDSMYVEFLADTVRGVLTVRETLFATSLTGGSRCDRPRRIFDIEAMGNEPFWRVTLDSAQMVLERPEPPLELVFDALPAETRGTLTTIRAHRVMGRDHDLTLAVLREPCRDPMSDSWYPYRAEVRFRALALHGCARR
jgi:uncharacterized membrane protein